MSDEPRQIELDFIRAYLREHPATLDGEILDAMDARLGRCCMESRIWAIAAVRSENRPKPRLKAIERGDVATGGMRFPPER
jgi:hypothetical protein